VKVRTDGDRWIDASRAEGRTEGSQQRVVKPRRKWTKLRTMWAYVCIDGQEIHCYTSQRKARGTWAEQGKSKRIRKVKIQWLNESSSATAATTAVKAGHNQKESNAK